MSHPKYLKSWKKVSQCCVTHTHMFYVWDQINIRNLQDFSTIYNLGTKSLLVLVDFWSECATFITWYSTKPLLHKCLEKGGKFESRLDSCRNLTTYLKFMFSKKATKFEKIFTVDLTLCSKCQMDGEDFVNFCGLQKKHEL